MSLSGSSETPLLGRRLLFLRDSRPLRLAAAAFEALGAEVVMAPIIELLDARPEDVQAGDRAIDRLVHDYEWVILTSQEGVARFIARCESRSLTLRGDHPKFAVVGRETEAQLQEHGIHAVLTPVHNFSQRGLMEELDHMPDLAGQRFLLAAADQARPDLERYLKSRGAQVERITMYRTVAKAIEPHVIGYLAHKAIEGVFYTSSASVKTLAENLPRDVYPSFQDTVAFSIGEQTSRELAHYGVARIITAPFASIPALVEAALGFFRGANGPD